MKRLLSLLVVMALGLGLLALASGLEQRAAERPANEPAVDGTCDLGELACALTASIRKEAHLTGANLRRQDISRDELPVLRISMDNGSIAKLDNKRKSVLAMPRPIHVAEDDDWVKATITVENQTTTEQSKVSLRLKGDWGDHLEHPKKLSFRIKTRAGGYLFGMKSFSVQHPTTRNYAYEPLMLDHMRANDILAPRYSFVDVYINGYPIGIMALEEHFRKEMIEAQNRRDGPLLAIDEDPLWDQWNINYNSDTPAGAGGFNFVGERDSRIKDFNRAKFVEGTIPTNNAVRGQALFRDFLDGKVPAGDAFDYDRLARFYVLTNVWGGCHAMTWHNRRVYFNPISGLLEPISFDNIPTPQSFKLCNGFDTAVALDDERFLDHIGMAAEDIYAQLTSEEFQTNLSERQDRIRTIFALEGLAADQKVVVAEDLIENLEKFLGAVQSAPGYAAPTNVARNVPLAGQAGVAFLQEQNDISLHMSSFAFLEQDGPVVEFRNLTLKPITVLGVYDGARNRDEDRRLPLEGSLDPIAPNAVATIAVDMTKAELASRGALYVDYDYDGQTHTRMVFTQLRNSPRGFVDDTIAAIRRVEGRKWVDIAGKKVVYAKGPHEFTESIEFPQDWTMIVQPGAVMNFRAGTLVKLRGPLKVEGTKEDPVIMNIESDLDYRSMGIWGGIFVSKSNERSIVNHLRLQGTGTQNLQTRQGFFGMTGCLSFYASDVTIRNSAFIDAQCEDALNIVKSDFILDNITIDGARADAFDSDFSTGRVVNSTFINSGNDGIDVSGTRLVVEDSVMNNIGDKAVSVGEQSYLTASRIDIDGAVLGLVSKDRSEAVADNVSFRDVSGTAVMAYVKKQEYGVSSAECNDCTFDGEFAQAGAQEGTTVTVNGRVYNGQRLSERQMREAGLIEDGS